MTEILKYIFGLIGKMFQLAMDLKFELFGFQVSMMSISISIFMIIGIVQFLKFFMPSTTSGIESIGKGRNENRMQKVQEKREQRAISDGAKHVNVTTGTHSKSFFKAVQRGNKR